jgi:PIN domain nuclease of toxin-antitoxin system
MKKYLLDTQIFLWTLLESGRFSKKGRSFLKDTQNNRFYLSHVSAWEICIKYNLGKLKLPKPPEAFIPETVLVAGYDHLPISLSHILASSSLARLHGDPFDRLLICQAKIERMPVVTADRIFRRYGAQVVPRSELF